jgi:hypothetical protein
MSLGMGHGNKKNGGLDRRFTYVAVLAAEAPVRLSGLKKRRPTTRVVLARGPCSKESLCQSGSPMTRLAVFYVRLLANLSQAFWCIVLTLCLWNLWLGL